MYSIEKASLDDIERLVEIQMSAFENDRRVCGSGPPGFDSIEHQIACFKDYFYFVVKCEEKIVGGFYFSGDEKHLNLIRLFIEPNYQRYGLGKMALSYLVSQASHGMHIDLETPTFSVNAHRFYEKNGFQKIRTVKYKFGRSFLYRLQV